jgi:hypothetical protein
MKLSNRASQILIVLGSMTAVLIFLMGGISSQAAPRAQINVKLSGDMQPDGDLNDFDFFAISPDSRYAVYLADAATDNVKDLYSVPTTGGAAPNLLVGGGA